MAASSGTAQKLAIGGATAFAGVLVAFGSATGTLAAILAAIFDPSALVPGNRALGFPIPGKAPQPTEATGEPNTTAGEAPTPELAPAGGTGGGGFDPVPEIPVF